MSDVTRELDVETKYREDLVEGRQQAQTSYDRAILTLSAGAMGVSLTFLKDIAGGGRAVQVRCSLVASWISLTLAVLFVVLSFVLSRRSFDVAIKNLDSQRNLGNLGGRFARWTEISNALAGISFLVGLVALCIFAYANLPPN
ncbi:MAG: hypothetical protein JNJ88_03650 [Planctomycetes bacterium]|nr:hypothetical protein [Planctomycetota bacterium]